MDQTLKFFVFFSKLLKIIIIIFFRIFYGIEVYFICYILAQITYLGNVHMISGKLKAFLIIYG